MPTYEYRCSHCQLIFSLMMSMAAHEERSVRCPSCKSDAVIPQFSTFYAKTSKKS